MDSEKFSWNEDGEVTLEAPADPPSAGDLRHNPNHDHATGKFSSGGGGGGQGGGSTVPGVAHYSQYQGDTVHGVAIPPLGDADRAQIEAKVLGAVKPSKAQVEKGKWQGKDEADVHEAGLLSTYARSIDDSIRSGRDEQVKELLTDSGEEKKFARGLSQAREVQPTIDSLVDRGVLVRHRVPASESPYGVDESFLRPPLAHEGDFNLYKQALGRSAPDEQAEPRSDPHRDADTGRFVHADALRRLVAQLNAMLGTEETPEAQDTPE